MSAKKYISNFDQEDYEHTIQNCAPTAERQTDPQPHVWFPVLRGAGITGNDVKVLTCLIDRRVDSGDSLEGIDTAEGCIE